MLHHSIISVVVFSGMGVLSFLLWWVYGNIFFNVFSVVSLAIAIALYFTLKIVDGEGKH